jgi:hypothetical protein
MKKIIFISVFLFACHKRNPPLSYIITLKYEEFDPEGYKPVVEYDTIMARNDTSAFKKGYSRFSSQVFLSKFIKSCRNVSFKIVDKNGKNLQEKLPASVIDSIKKKINEIDEETLRNVTKVKIKDSN